MQPLTRSPPCAKKQLTEPQHCQEEIQGNNINKTLLFVFKQICFSNRIKMCPKATVNRPRGSRPVLTLSQQPSTLHDCHLFTYSRRNRQVQNYTRKGEWPFWAISNSQHFWHQMSGHFPDQQPNPQLSGHQLDFYWFNSILTLTPWS